MIQSYAGVRLIVVAEPMLPRQENLGLTYDGLSQILNAQRGVLNINRTAIGGIPASEEQFNYDETGNWLAYRTESNGTPALDQARRHDRDNRMVQVDGSSAGITYDQAGNLTQGPLNDTGPHHQMKWDAWNRLTEVRTATGALVMQCGYDGLFRRITKKVGASARHFYYSDRWKPLEEYLE